MRKTFITIFRLTNPDDKRFMHHHPRLFLSWGSVGSHFGFGAALFQLCLAPPFSPCRFAGHPALARTFACLIVAVTRMSVTTLRRNRTADEHCQRSIASRKPFAPRAHTRCSQRSMESFRPATPERRCRARQHEFVRRHCKTAELRRATQGSAILLITEGKATERVAGRGGPQPRKAWPSSSVSRRGAWRRAKSRSSRRAAIFCPASAGPRPSHGLRRI